MTWAATWGCPVGYERYEYGALEEGLGCAEERGAINLLEFDQASKGQQAERVQTGRGTEGRTEGVGSTTIRDQQKGTCRSPLPVLSLPAVSVPRSPPPPAADDPPDQSAHVHSSLTLRQHACVVHVTSAARLGGLSSHVLPRTGASTYGKLFGERGHVHVTFITAYCCNCSLLLLLMSCCA